MLKGLTTPAAILLKYDLSSCSYETKMDLSHATIFLDPKQVVNRFQRRDVLTTRMTTTLCYD